MRNVECGMRNSTRSSARSPNRRDDDCHELTRFVPQGSHALGVAQSTLDDQIEPELRLVCLLLHDPQLCNELLARPRATGGAIIRSHGRAGPQELIPNHVRRTASREGFNQANDRQCKGPRTILQVNPAHDFPLTFRIPHSEFRIQSFLTLTSAHCSCARRRYSRSRSGPTSSNTASTSSAEAPVLSAPRRCECSCWAVPSTAIAATVASSRRFRSSPGRPITLPYASTSTRSSSAGCSARRLTSSLW